MLIEGNYRDDGFALVRGLIPREICYAFVNQIKADFEKDGRPLEAIGQSSPLLKRDAIEVYGYHYPAMLMLLWGLTPIIADLAGKDLLPTYDYFRIYREGDICRVHSDRPSCEHSVSLTLDYSDGELWPLEVGKNRIAEPSPIVSEDFDGAPYASLAMQPGDAVLYNGVNLRHGRMKPNPNAWSAHLFLHWVERGGRYAEFAFDGNGTRTKPANFNLR